MLAAIAVYAFSLIAAIVPTFSLPGHADAPPPAPYPAPPGYLLPWPGGQLHQTTQGEETSLTHNGYAAYAFDFDLHYDVVVAARGGKVVMVRQDSSTGGCSSEYSGAANYVVIDHGDGTSGLYLHLAPKAVLVQVGEVIRQGEPIAVSGETGLTCSGDGLSPGLHLHFQVEKTDPDRYFTQSLPIAFDDIADNGGVPVEGETYASANYGNSKKDDVVLTPHHDPRPFHPTARPANPALAEGDKDAPPPPPPPDPDAPPPVDDSLPADAGVPAPEDTSTPEGTRTPRPTHTPTPAPVPSDTPLPTSTAVPPTTTPAPPPTNTPPPVPTDTPEPLPTDTAIPPSTDTPEPPPATPTPSA